MQENERFSVGCRRMAELIRETAAELYRPGNQHDWFFIEVDDIDLAVGLDYDQVNTCLDVLKHFGLIIDYKNPGRQKIVLRLSDKYIRIKIAEDFFKHCRTFLNKTVLDLHRIVLDSTNGELFDEVDGRVLATLGAGSNAMAIAEYLFVIRTKDRGTWIPWDDIYSHISGTDDFGSKTKRRSIYDGVIAINSKTEKAAGITVIQNHGEKEYMIPM